MKYLARKLVTAAVNNEILWPALKPVLTICNFAYYSRKNPDDVSNVYAHLFERATVLNGPFKDMKYPSLEAVGSVVAPKLLGSYEMELHDTINELRDNKYSEIIDVGCAEGYYAVGLSRLFPEAKVYAYDIDKKARTLCAAMAKLNSCDAQITVRENCDADELGRFKFTERGLIVCDCEGFEMQLFNEKNIGNLLKCDVIIEIHDFVNIEISGYLRNLFEETHDIKVVKSVDDLEKAKTYQFEETQNASLNDKLKLFREWRPFIMEWLVCTPK